MVESEAVRSDFPCPFCECVFSCLSDLDLHLKAFGVVPHTALAMDSLDLCPFDGLSCNVVDLCDSADNLRSDYSVVKECSTTLAQYMVRENLFRRVLIPKDFVDAYSCCPICGVQCTHCSSSGICCVLSGLLFDGVVKESCSCPQGVVEVREYLVRMNLTKK